MIKVEWNDKRTWKITKRYQGDKLIALQFKGKWYYPIEDHRGRETDCSGNTYVACDCCGYCALRYNCCSRNPIYNACEETDMLEVSWI